MRTDPAIAAKYADYYEDHSLTEWRKLGAVEKAANIAALTSPNPASVLEIGCGDGAIIERMVACGLWDKEKVCGLEISASAIQLLMSKGINAQQFEGVTIPFDDRHFELAVLSHVIEHVEYPRQLLYEAKRVAREVYIEVPMEDNTRLSHDFVADQTGHINFYNPKTIRQLVQSCGLRILKTKISHSSPAQYKFQKGASGMANYLIKEALLKSVPGIATYLFTYHYSILAG